MCASAIFLDKGYEKISLAEVNGGLQTLGLVSH